MSGLRLIENFRFRQKAPARQDDMVLTDNDAKTAIVSLQSNMRAMQRRLNQLY